MPFAEKAVISTFEYICIRLICICRFANVIKVDGGGAFGELVGPSKNCTSISLSNRLCLLASDDKTLTVYKASPSFKFVKTLKDHDGFVQVVRFNDKVFASAGADGKVVIYSTDSFDSMRSYSNFILTIYRIE